MESSTVPLNARPGTFNAPPGPRSAAHLSRLPVMLRQLARRIPESLRPGPGRPPGREFRLGRAWVLAILCGLFGLSLVLVVLAVVGGNAPAPAPLTVGTGPGPATSSAPAPAPPAPPTPASRSDAEAPAPRSKAPARSAGGSASSDDDDDDDGSADSGSDSGSGSGSDSGSRDEWGRHGREYDMAREMMRYRMNNQVHRHPW